MLEVEGLFDKKLGNFFDDFERCIREPLRGVRVVDVKRLGDELVIDLSGDPKELTSFFERVVGRCITGLLGAAG